VAAAAKLCYSDCGIDEITEGLTTTNAEMFLGKLIDMGHESPLEHASFTFGIEGISRACSHQLVRHRIASYSQKSQRYVSEGGFDYVIPPEIAKNDVLTRDYESSMIYLEDCYGVFVRNLMALGRTKEQAQEDARYLLPNACTTSIVTTMNIRILLHFFKKRCCNRAQWEIRSVADEMLRQCLKIAPILFKNAGAPCVGGNCPEGTMTCGEPRQ
nr:FAD-dependent thymidylate synthase [Acetobacterium sp.]